VVSRDMVAGAVLLAASLGYYLMATGIPVTLIDTTVNSSALPKMLGIAGAGLSLVLIVQALLRQRRASAAPAPSGAGTSQGWLQHKRALGILIIVVAYALLLNVLGYLLSVALLLGATAYYQARFYRNVRSMPVMIGLALGGALLFWAIFDQLLGIPMPAGFWRHLS
jgi:putative tricarboxylic transport membrane protein